MPRRPGRTVRSSSRSSKRAEAGADERPEARAGWLAVGEVVAAHGLRGWLRVRAYQPPAPSLAPDRLVRLEGPRGGREAPLPSAPPHRPRPPLRPPPRGRRPTAAEARGRRPRLG